MTTTEYIEVIERLQGQPWTPGHVPSGLRRDTRANGPKENFANLFRNCIVYHRIFLVFSSEQWVLPKILLNISVQISKTYFCQWVFIGKWNQSKLLSQFFFHTAWYPQFLLSTFHFGTSFYWQCFALITFQPMFLL